MPTLQRLTSSAQFLKTFQDERFVRAAAKRGFVLPQIFTVTAGASEPD